MPSYKVCVYAICKNEEAFAAHFMESMREADAVIVLDTGSTDGSVERLRSLGAQVYQECIRPWRFDTARNRSLALVPDDADICVCVDLDERFTPGWRQKLEQAWTPDTDRASYRYTWNFREDGSEGCVFFLDKIHARHGFRWKYPVHEVLEFLPDRPCRSVCAVGVQLNHHADPSKSRAQYLPLLELAVREYPQDDRNVHYLGREYMFRGRWDDCIRTLLQHLDMPQATWREERAASMRFLAFSYLQKGQKDLARVWYHRSIAEAPNLREPYIDFAKMLYAEQDWYGVLFLVRSALRIQNRPPIYISEADAWGSLPYDLASLAYYYTGALSDALNAVDDAIALSPKDARLLGNRQFFLQKLAKVT